MALMRPSALRLGTNGGAQFTTMNGTMFQAMAQLSRAFFLRQRPLTCRGMPATSSLVDIVLGRAAAYV